MGLGTAWIPGIERTTLLLPMRATFGGTVPLVPALAFDATVSAGTCLAFDDEFTPVSDIRFRALVSAGVGVTWVP